MDAISARDIGAIFSVVLLNFLNPVMKLINKTAKWSWDFLKSVNFWTQLATVILVGLSLLGVVFPQGAAAGIVEAVFSGEANLIITAIAVNVINPLYHFIFDRGPKQVAAAGG